MLLHLVVIEGYSIKGVFAPNDAIMTEAVNPRVQVASFAVLV